MSPNHHRNDRTIFTRTSDIDAFVTAFFQSLAEMFGVETDRSRHRRLEADLQRREREVANAREEAIHHRYPDAWRRVEEIAYRAALHDVTFSRFLSNAEKLAILDFLDTPDAPTLLDWGRMTQFWGPGPDGNPTGSVAHPVERAKYNWNARDLDRRPPTGIPSRDAAIANLRTHYPIECVSWTGADWEAYADRRSSPPRPAPRPSITSEIPSVL